MSAAAEPDAASILALARSVAMPLPEATLPGVIANARILADHMARVLQFALPDDCPVATGFHP